MNVLAVVAHPDDESFSCGGTLAMHAQKGDVVTVVALSDGVGSRFWYRGKDGIPAKGEHEAWIARKKAFERACAILGVRGKIECVFPDQESDTIPQLQINKAVESILVSRRPELIYTHHVGDLNLDHRRVAEAVLVETRGACPVFCAEPEWPERAVVRFRGAKRHDITATFHRKLKACAAYSAEMRAYPHPRSEEALIRRAKRWGSIGEYAEAFMEIR